jgi:SAM-dependent methyltransferase
MSDGDRQVRSIRAEYERLGVERFYAEHGAEYVNRHEDILRDVLRSAVERWTPDLTHVLDLACGSGEATLALRPLGAGRIEGVDPYTGAAYVSRTGQAAEAITFEDIAAGALAGRRYSLIVCSFALHLVEPSRLPRVAYQLSQISPALLLLTPHKRPVLRRDWGWRLEGEFVQARVRARLYLSSLGSPSPRMWFTLRHF